MTSPKSARQAVSDSFKSTTGSVRILIVDDDEAIRRLLGHLLKSYGYPCTLVGNAREARLRLSEQEFSLVLCDVNMPGESGLELVRHVLRDHPFIAVVMVTGMDDPQFADIALENGAYGYILKPFKPNEILISVANALRRQRLEIENFNHREKLEQMVLERTSALRQAIARLEQAEQEARLSQEETIQRLAIAIELRDQTTADHIRRMSHYCELLARKSGLDMEWCNLIRIASPMHDIGKIGTPDRVLLKPGKFTPEEFQTITRHTEIGYQLLGGSNGKLLKMAATIAWTHHEKFDGTGYPRGLSGETIPLEGRIAAIADVFDALTNKRAYKPAYSVKQTLEIMQERRGKHFDPALLDPFLQSIDEALAIKNRYTDSSSPS